MYVLVWRTVYVLTRGLFLVFISPCWAATREINSKITLKWAHKQFVTRVHTLFYFLHDITNPKMTLKLRISTHHSHVSLARFTLCWWRHNWLGLSRVTDYPWAVRFSVVTGYKFTNRLTGSCTDDLVETWSCQNHEKVRRNSRKPIVYMSENAFTFCIRPINRSPGASQLAFSPARGRLGTGATWWRNWDMVLNKRGSFSQESISEFMKLRTISTFLCHQMTAFRWIIIIT